MKYNRIYPNFVPDYLSTSFSQLRLDLRLPVPLFLFFLFNNLLSSISDVYMCMDEGPSYPWPHPHKAE